MPTTLTAEDARQSLTDHLVGKGEAIRQTYGSPFGWAELLRLLEDRSQVRYPCALVLDSGPLLPGECAHPVQKGERPEDGFDIFVHPYFAEKHDQAVFHVLYQLVVVNYGGFATPEDAETVGARALGLSRDEYYQILCRIADEMSQSVG
jgi:hypothetical protein